MNEYYNDNVIKFEYNEQNNKFQFALNEIGSQASVQLEEKNYTDDDENTIYVQTGGSGVGTKADPVGSIFDAINATTSLKTKVIVLDSELYAENISSCTYDFLQGIYAETSETPYLSLRPLSFTPSNSNSIFVKLDGDDDNDGTIENPVLTIKRAKELVDATHQNVIVLDSETYEVFGFRLIDNFAGLYAAEGESPTFVMKEGGDYSNPQDILNKTLFVDYSTLPNTCKLANGNIVFCYTNSGDLNYKIIDSNNTTILSETLIFSYAVRSFCQQLNNGNIVFVYVDGSPQTGIYMTIWDQSGNQVLAPTQVHPIATGMDYTLQIDVFANDDVAISWYDTTTFRTYVCIYSVAGAQVLAPMDATGRDYYRIDITALHNDNLALVYAGGDGYWRIINKSGVDVLSEVLIYNTYMYNPLILQNVYNDIVIGWNDAEGDDTIKFTTYKIDGTQILSPTIISGSIFVNSFYEMVELSNTDILFGWSSDSAYLGYYSIFDINGDEQVSAVLFENDDIINLNIIHHYSTYIHLAWRDRFGGDTYPYHKVIDIYDKQGVSVDVSSNIKGIIFEPLTSDFKQMIKAESALTIEHCEIKDVINDDNDAVAILSTNDLTISNCNIHDNDAGINAVDDNVDIKDSQFYRNNYNNAIEIDGSGSSVIIEHNTIVNNYRGVQLLNNDSNEVVKNNIIHDNDLAGIEADTSLNILYCVYTDTNINIIESTGCLKANPLFIDEGLLIPADIDLHIRVRILGYLVDSPALLLSDDNRNCGCFDIKYIGDNTSWDEFTIGKPILGISSYIESTNESKVVKIDGTIETLREGATEYLALKFESISNADFDNLKELWKDASSKCRIYLDPITCPNAFDIYKLIYNKINQTPKHFKLARSGVQDVELVFGKKYELAD